MRKIEQRMVAAIKAGRPFHSGNTAVEMGALGNWRVTLHGNLIATGGAKSFDFTLAGWNTPTTRSRVNALIRELGSGCGLSYVYCRDFTPYYNGEQIGSKDWITVRREVKARTPVQIEHDSTSPGVCFCDACIAVQK